MQAQTHHVLKWLDLVGSKKHFEVFRHCLKVSADPFRIAEVFIRNLLIHFQNGKAILLKRELPFPAPYVADCDGILLLESKIRFGYPHFGGVFELVRLFFFVHDVSREEVHGCLYCRHCDDKVESDKLYFEYHVEEHLEKVEDEDRRRKREAVLELLSTERTTQVAASS